MGKVRCSFLDLPAGEVLGGPAAGVMGVKDVLPLLRQPFAGLVKAALPAVKQEGRHGHENRCTKASHGPCSFVRTSNHTFVSGEESCTAIAAGLSSL